MHSAAGKSGKKMPSQLSDDFVVASRLVSSLATRSGPDSARVSMRSLYPVAQSRDPGCVASDGDVVIPSVSRVVLCMQEAKVKVKVKMKMATAAASKERGAGPRRRSRPSSDFMLRTLFSPICTLLTNN